MVNKVILIGNIGMEPEVRTLETGVKVARLRVATTERFTSNAGEKKEHTEWHTVVLWRSQADFAEKFMHKGSQIFVDGKIRTRERVDEVGNKRTIYEIHAEEVRILGKRESNPNNNPEQPAIGSIFGGAYNAQPTVDQADTFASDPLPF